MKLHNGLSLACFGDAATNTRMASTIKLRVTLPTLQENQARIGTLHVHTFSSLSGSLREVSRYEEKVENLGFERTSLKGNLKFLACNVITRNTIPNSLTHHTTVWVCHKRT